MPNWLGGSKPHVPQAPYFVQHEERGRARVRESATRSTSDLGRVHEDDETTDYRNTVPQRASSRVAGTNLPYLRSAATPPPSEPPSSTLPPVPSVPTQYVSAPRSHPRYRTPLPATQPTAQPVPDSPIMQGRSLTPTGSDAPSPATSVQEVVDPIVNPGPPPAHGHPEQEPAESMPGFYQPSVGVKPRLLRLNNNAQTAATSVPTPPRADVSSPAVTPTAATTPTPQQSAQRAPTATFIYPPNIQTIPQLLSLPQPPTGPQCQLFEFRYHSEAVEGAQDMWAIELRYKVRIVPVAFDSATATQPR